ncbi:hypothetical protein E4T56_gene468 [Termitomyces sp. T112]|nr:hypothetical protein E4T56_gene468 [Termitomyces sp. T112]
MGDEGSTYRALPTAPRPPHWQATLPNAAPSPPLPGSPPCWTPAESLASPTPPIIAPLPLPVPPMAPYALAALEAVTVTPWHSLQSPSLSFPTLQTSSPHVANNLSNSSTQCHRKALATDYDPPADCSTKAPEVGEYTMGPRGPTIAGSPHARLLGPTSSKGDTLHLLLFSPNAPPNSPTLAHSPHPLWATPTLPQQTPMAP